MSVSTLAVVILVESVVIYLAGKQGDGDFHVNLISR